MKTASPAAAAACLFDGFSDSARLGILQLLSHGELRTVDVVTALRIPQSTASKHLACLRDCGLVEARPVGRASYYRLAHPVSTLALLRAAEQLLGETGAAVTLCENFGLGSAGPVS
jgi:ArsR family transcriptional regulator, cadmium/lead-responsive transcriptional repressor